MTDSRQLITINATAVALLICTGMTLGASVRQVWLYDFLEHESSATIVRQLKTEFRTVTSGQVEKESIYQQAGIRGDKLVKLTYSNVPVPKKVKGLDSVYLHFFTGIEDGDAFNLEPDVDGCRFIIRINGRKVFSTRHKWQRWIEHQVNLSRYAGKEVEISFLVDPVRSSTADWAAWGQPKIYVEGKGEFIDALAAELGQTEPANSPQAIQGPQQITRVNKDDKSVTMVAVLDGTLDADTVLLNAESSDEAIEETSPRLVAGQGADPANHTIVRILNEYGIAEMQFLAFPIFVTGGVQVEVGHDNLGYTRIVTAPLSDREVCFLRIFNEYGGFVRDIPISSELSAPFVINVGQYDPDRPGEEIAVTSAHQKAGCDMKILFYGIDGAYITYRRLPIETDTPAVMATQQGEKTDTLHVYLENEHLLSSLAWTEGEMVTTEEHEPDLIESLNSKGIPDVSAFKGKVDLQHLSTYGVTSEKVMDYRVGPLDDLTAGTVVEITFKAKTISDGRITFGIYQGRTLLEGLRQVFGPPVDKWKYYRFIFRVQRPANNLTLRLQTDDKILLEDFDANLQTEQVDPAIKPQVTFDFLE